MSEVHEIAEGIYRYRTAIKKMTPLTSRSS